MRLIAEVDGDIIVNFEPNIGYVHRAVEKLAETKTYLQIIPLVERPMLPDTANANLGYILALEKLLDLEIPPRAQYLRMLICEMSRIHSHLYGLGIFGNMIGSSTVFEWAFQDREPFLELTQQWTGARLTPSFMVPGGIRRDLPADFKDKALKVVAYFEDRLNDYNKIFVDNPVTMARLVGVGVIPKSEALKIGIVGPNLRASGVAYDARKNEPYCAYDELDFDLITLEEGDCYARLLVLREEMKQSLSLMRQILDKLPSGPYFAEKYLNLITPEMREVMNKTNILRFPKLFTELEPSKGEAVSRIEAGRGELFSYILSDGTTKPYRFRMITPSFKNVAAFRSALLGARLADVPSVYGSLDYFPPEADR